MTKTTNFNIELMQTNIANKDIIFNETISYIDNFMLNSAYLIDEEDSNIPDGSKAIITKGENKNKIAYKTNALNKLQYLNPVNGMVYFIINKAEFYYYFDNEWRIYKPSDSICNSNYDYSTLTGEYILKSGYAIEHFYLNDDAKIIVKELSQSSITLIIKQNHSKSCKLEFSENILWPLKRPPKINLCFNSFSIYKIHKLPEKECFLGEIINEEYNY